MNTSVVLVTLCAVGLVTSGLAVANPAMLPRHPGYPMDQAIDPVHGQSLANDPGQSNAVGDPALREASAFEDTHVMQSLSFNPNERELREKSGGVVQPKAQAPDKRK